MLRPGDVFGDRFEILGVLGRGGMATVHLANDRVRDERVALKVLHSHLAQDPAMRARLRREVQAARLLRSDAALVPYDLHDAEGTLALTMPYHPGRTLAERVGADGALPAREVRVLGIRIASALAEAHRNGVLHRDVTPNNVMLDDAASAVLTDYGLARLGDRTGTASAVMGTPGYAAPEVYRGVRTDPRSDLYSLGAVLYLAATGRPPFHGATPAQALDAQLRDRPTPVSELRPDLDEDLARTIEAMLRHDPGARPQTAGEVADALERREAPAAPVVPDTWLGDVPAPAPLTARAPILDPGTWTVVVKGHRRPHKAPSELADVLARVAGLPPGAVKETPTLGDRELRLVTGVAREVADRLAEAANVAGYRARAVDTTPPGPLGLAAQHLVLLIPALWVLFPFLVAAGMDPLLLLPVFIIASIVLGPLEQAIAPPKVSASLGLAFERDLAAHVDPARLPADPAPSPAAHPAAPEVRRGGVLRQRALAAISALETAVDARRASLPEPAVRDLHETASRLRAPIAEIADEIDRIEAELDAPCHGDATWAQARLERLETLARAGDDVDDVEVARLRSAIAALEQTESARAASESRLSAGLAQLLEIASAARRARLEIASGDDVGQTAELLVGRLRREVDAIAAARASVEDRAPPPARPASAREAPRR